MLIKGIPKISTSFHNKFKKHIRSTKHQFTQSNLKTLIKTSQTQISYLYFLLVKFAQINELPVDFKSVYALSFEMQLYQNYSLKSPAHQLRKADNSNQKFK
jgi:hypothetical protein